MDAIDRLREKAQNEQTSIVLNQLLKAEKQENAKLREELEAATKDLDSLIVLRNILVLCGEPECKDIKDHADKLRALINGLIVAKRESSEYKQRAEAAEARIREAEGHKPVATALLKNTGNYGIQFHKEIQFKDGMAALYTRPIPAPDVAELQEFLRKEKIVSDNLGKIADSQAEKIVQLESQLEASQSQVKVLREVLYTPPRPIHSPLGNSEFPEAAA